jgi:hypothetical protein
VKRESIPGVGIIRYRHFGLSCSCGAAQMSQALTDEQIAVCERDPVAGLHELTAKDREAVVRFYAEHCALGHEPIPSVVGEIPE